MPLSLMAFLPTSKEVQWAAAFILVPHDTKWSTAFATSMQNSSTVPDGVKCTKFAVESTYII